MREPAKCVSCSTKDCIRGNGDTPGCELHLFQPRKSSNMDCTFCLDCIHACPHDNVGILAAPLGKALWHDPPRSGVGRFSRRPDLAALVLVLVFGSFANAAGMVGPVVEWEQLLQRRLGLASPLALVSGFYFAALVLLPLGLAIAAAGISRAWASLDEGLLRTATRFSFALVPLGFAMWLAHYSFHFFSSYDTAIPATQRFAADLGISLLGPPQWSCSCCRPAADWLPRLEILILDFGLLLSLYTAFRIAQNLPAGSCATGKRSLPVLVELCATGKRSLPVATLNGDAALADVACQCHTSQTLKAAIPWVLLIALLFAAGVWIVLQPMQMRGMMASG